MSGGMDHYEYTSPPSWRDQMAHDILLKLIEKAASRERADPQAVAQVAYMVADAMIAEGECDAKLIPDGWAALAWADRLEQMASCCEQDHPKRANGLRAWATRVRALPIGLQETRAGIT